MIPIYQNGKSTNPAEFPTAAVEKLQYNNGAKGDEVEALFALLGGEFKHHPVVKKRNAAINQQGSTESSSNLAQFSIFPNPSNGNAAVVYQLNGNQNANLQVFDVNGRLVKEQQLSTVTERQKLDVSHLNNGVYHFLVTLKGESLFNGKLVMTQ
jgi:hypothetical protein